MHNTPENVLLIIKVSWVLKWMLLWKEVIYTVNMENIHKKLLTVTVASRPSGTLATMIPIKKMQAVSQWYPRISERIKNVTPRVTATPVIMWMKCSISTAMGVFPDPNPLAKLAMRPMTVLSPVWTTIPVQVPSTAFVEKNAKFFVSKGLSWVNSGVRAWGSDSPVRDELST